jgi:hypothetical protein
VFKQKSDGLKTFRIFLIFWPDKRQTLVSGFVVVILARVEWHIPVNFDEAGANRCNMA